MLGPSIQQWETYFLSPSFYVSHVDNLRVYDRKKNFYFYPYLREREILKVPYAQSRGTTSILRQRHLPLLAAAAAAVGGLHPEKIRASNEISTIK